MEIIKFLGDILAKEIKISPPAARGLLKLALKDQFGPFKNLEELDFQELKTMILNSFKKRLEELHIENTNKILNLMEKELLLNQSLITITKI